MVLTYNDILKEVGGFGPYQKIFAVVVFLSSVPNAFAVLMFVFIHSTPPHRCYIPAVDDIGNITLPHTNKSQLLQSMIPHRIKYGVLTQDQCHRYNATFNTSGNINKYSGTDDIIQCDQGWVFDSSPGLLTATMDLELICNNAWLGPIANSGLMFGMLFSAFFGKLSDKYGRKPVYLFSTAGQFILTGVLGFAHTPISYILLNVILGMVSMANYLSIYVIGCEIVPPERRSFLGFLNFAAFSVGYVVTSLFAYYVQHWRWFMCLTSLVGILYIPTIWLVPESPLWLLRKGRIGDTKLILRKIAKTNKRVVNIDDLFNQELCLKEKEDKTNKNEVYFDALKNEIIRWRLLTVYLQWFCVSLVYYVITFGISSLSSNIFIATGISGLLEIPSFLFATFSIGKIGEVRTHFTAMLLTSVTCIILPIAKKKASMWVTTTIAMLGKFAVNMGFYMVYMIHTEITPTLLRGTSMFVGNSCGKIGAFIAPYFVHIGMQSSLYIPYWSMATLMLIAGVCSILIIPETRNIQLPTTIQEANENKRIYGLKLWKTFKNEDNEIKL